MKLRNLFFMALFGLCALSCGKDDDSKPVPAENNAPDYGEDKSVTVSEGISDTHVIGTYTATDADQDDELVYSITTNNNGLFEIDAATGQLSLVAGQSLDADDSPYTITLTVSDGTDTDSVEVTITVTEEEQANLPPTVDTENVEFAVAEDIADDYIIGTVSANDPEGMDLIYSIETDMDLFEISDQGEITLVAGQNLDYETQEEYTVTVRASDGEKFAEAEIGIFVQNVIETLFEDPDSFITTWKTTADAEEIGIGTNFFHAGYDYIINWGDGSAEEHLVNSNPPTHSYQKAGTYTVAIKGQFPRIIMADTSWSDNIMSIEQWGNTSPDSFENAFKNCVNLVYNAMDAPDLSQVTSLASMFSGASSFNGNLNNWEVNTIENMELMFFLASSFDGNISSWDVYSVTDMRGMFFGTPFNQNIGDWKVEKVIETRAMFANTTAFNQDLSSWKMGSVTDMQAMFSNAITFNQSLGKWNISSVDIMIDMLDNSGLSPANYDATLLGWANNANTPDDITLGADGVYYCDDEGRAILEGKGWTITDEGVHASCQF